MRVVAAITMYNEVLYGPHVYRQLDNALGLSCYDDIVVLDDGSTDGTWEILEEYSSNYSNIHIFKNSENSILNKKANRWHTLYEILKSFDPTWVHIRAADMLFSHPTSTMLRPQLEKFLKEDVILVGTPIVHLWRSETWYRADGPWGRQASNNYYKLIYKFNKNLSWSSDHKKSGMHQNMYLPSNLKKTSAKRIRSLNDGCNKPFPMVALHLGHTTHDKKCRKFDWSMESATAAAKVGRSFGMPPPNRMPHPKDWMKHTGYPGFVEWGGFKLAKVPQVWYEDPVVHGSSPISQSFYETIKKWNIKRAEEYKLIFEKHWKEED